MNGAALKRSREARGWTQAEVSRRLKVTQAYISMLEQEKRPLPVRLARRAVRLLRVSPTALPLVGESQWKTISEDDFARELGTLGYEGFGHLRGSTARWNPADLLLAMLTKGQLDGRLREALPWLPFVYPELDWNWAVQNAKLHDAQNRLGFVVELARSLAATKRRDDAVARLDGVLQPLVNARLAKEDTLCHETMTQVERRWLRENRPPQAERWNLLTDLKLKDVAYGRD